MKATTRFRLLDYLLYSYTWIALAALLLLQQTRLLLLGRLWWDALAGLLFFGTLALYALHRRVGLARGIGRRQFPLRGRAARILWLSLSVGLAGTAYFFVQLSQPVQFSLLLPALLALGYALPLPGGRRLRDYHYVKIFLIAIVWAWVTVAVPYLQMGQGQAVAVGLMLLERLCFCFAIALGFDIRDIAVDRAARVNTLPTRLGRRRARRLALGVLLFSGGFILLNLYLHTYSRNEALALALVQLSAGALIWRANGKRHDYYFSALLDGTMILSFICVYLFQ